MSEHCSEHGLMKMHINSAQIKTKTRGIDTKKRTLAYIWYEYDWHAYDTKFSRAYDIEICWHVYDTHLPHNPNPTHCVAYTRQSHFFLYQYHKFSFLFGTLFIRTFKRSGWSSRLAASRSTSIKMPAFDSFLIFSHCVESYSSDYIFISV